MRDSDFFKLEDSVKQLRKHVDKIQADSDLLLGLIIAIGDEITGMKKPTSVSAPVSKSDCGCNSGCNAWECTRL